MMLENYPKPLASMIKVILDDIEDHWECWRRPLRLNQATAPYNKRIKKHGYTATDLCRRLNKEGVLLYLVSPLNKKYICPMTALKTMTRAELLEELLELDKQNISVKGI